ncbi:unnamed protein product [Urochloa humidicola]
MAFTTRIAVSDCLTRLERRDPPPCVGPSSVRIRCTTARVYSTRKLGGGITTTTTAPGHRGEPPAGTTDEQTFRAPDPSVFLRYEESRRVIHGMLASMPLLRGVDLSPDNWVFQFTPEFVAKRMLDWARQDDEDGLAGAHYHFYVEIAMEVRLVYSEPKAVVRACAEIVMQTAEPRSDSANNQCSICMEGFQFQSDCAGAMSPLNLPCSHCFHVRCITVWLFKGHTCPICRHDLRGLVSQPWASQACKLA